MFMNIVILSVLYLYISNIYWRGLMYNISKDANESMCLGGCE